jgi:N-acyl homoserine lactone hydrolase
LSDKTSSSSVELEVMLTGEVPMPHAYVFRPHGGNRLTRLAAVLRPGGAMVRAPCLAYVVRHPSAGTILIDTGMHADATENPRKDFGRRMAFLFRSLKPADVPYDEQLRRLGVEPADVMRVLMTHLHVDHSSSTCAPSARSRRTRKTIARRPSCLQTIRLPGTRCAT